MINKKLLENVENLSPEDKLELIEVIAHQLKESQQTLDKNNDWRKIKGIGKGIWDQDAQEHVNHLRVERL